MWPVINEIRSGPDQRFELTPREALQECEAVARTRRRWEVREVDVAGLRLDAARLSSLGLEDLFTIRVEPDGDGALVVVEASGRAPRWKLRRTLEGYLEAVGEAARRRREGLEAGT